VVDGGVSLIYVRIVYVNKKIMCDLCAVVEYEYMYKKVFIANGNTLTSEAIAAISSLLLAAAVGSISQANIADACSGKTFT